MNAGSWGRSISEVLSWLTLLRPDGRLTTVPREELTFSYRRWEDRRDEVVVEAGFALTCGDKAQVKTACQDYLKQRRARQPQKVASAGSFFKNPSEHFAGRLIEEAGLKGLTVGGAMVSPVHANFLVNTGAATAADLLALMTRVQAAVQARTGIRLEPEVHILKNSEEQP
jgi:UDP-N-acetylmuramate dehydrogenase